MNKPYLQLKPIAAILLSLSLCTSMPLQAAPQSSGLPIALNLYGLKGESRLPHAYNIVSLTPENAQTRLNQLKAYSRAELKRTMIYVNVTQGYSPNYRRFFENIPHIDAVTFNGPKNWSMTTSELNDVAKKIKTGFSITGAGTFDIINDGTKLTSSSIYFDGSRAKLTDGATASLTACFNGAYYVRTAQNLAAVTAGLKNNSSRRTIALGIDNSVSAPAVETFLSVAPKWTFDTLGFAYFTPLSQSALTDLASMTNSTKGSYGVDLNFKDQASFNHFVQEAADNMRLLKIKKVSITNIGQTNLSWPTDATNKLLSKVSNTFTTNIPLQAEAFEGLSNNKLIISLISPAADQFNMQAYSEAIMNGKIGYLAIADAKPQQIAAIPAKNLAFAATKTRDNHTLLLIGKTVNDVREMMSNLNDQRIPEERGHAAQALDPTSFLAGIKAGHSASLNDRTQLSGDNYQALIGAQNVWIIGDEDGKVSVLLPEKAY